MHHKPCGARLVVVLLAEGAQRRVSCSARRRATRQHASRRVLGAAGGAVFERHLPPIVVRVVLHICVSQCFTLQHVACFVVPCCLGG
jgi:hypothetical protein